MAQCSITFVIYYNCAVHYTLMDKLTLGEAVREYGFELCELVRIIQQENLKYESTRSNILLHDEELIRYKLRQPDYSVGEFRKVAEKYSGDSRGLEELMNLVVSCGKYEFIFIPELEEQHPFETLLEEEKYEWLYNFFREDEEMYEQIVHKFAETNSVTAAKVGIQHRDEYLVRMAMEKSDSPNLIQAVYLLAEQVDPGFAEMLSIKDLSGVEDYLEEARQIMFKIGVNIPTVDDELERERKRAKIRVCKEAVSIIKKLSQKVSKMYGLKLTTNIALSEPRGNYATIRYSREDLDNDDGDFAAARA